MKKELGERGPHVLTPGQGREGVAGVELAAVCPPLARPYRRLSESHLCDLGSLSLSPTSLICKVMWLDWMLSECLPEP